MAKRVVNCFPVPLGFPTTDPIALDLLGLMTGYNDLIALAEWASYDKELADDPAEDYIRIGQRFVKLRFIASVFYEVLLVLERLEQEPGFKQIAGALDEQGEAALKRLRTVRCGRDPEIRNLLDRTRNRVTFHYHREEFRKSLEKMIALRGTSCAYPAVIHYEGDDMRRWYPLAEHLQTDNAFAVSPGRDQLLKNLEDIVGRLDGLAEVLNKTFREYIKQRKLEKIFSL